MTTTTVFSNTSDGMCDYAVEGTYGGAHADFTKVNGNLSPSFHSETAAGALQAKVGMSHSEDTRSGDSWWGWTYTPSRYDISEVFLSFDTSSIADTDVVSAATLSTAPNGTATYTPDRTLDARLYDWDTTLTSADYRSDSELSGYALLASHTTAHGFGTNGTRHDWDSESAFATNINKTGSTRIVIDDHRRITGTAPAVADNPFVYLLTAETAIDPKLVITHAAPAGGLTTVNTYMGVALTAISTIDSVPIANIDILNGQT